MELARTINLDKGTTEIHTLFTNPRTDLQPLYSNEKRTKSPLLRNLYNPRGSFKLNQRWRPTRKRSTDRPQHPFSSSSSIAPNPLSRSQTSRQTILRPHNMSRYTPGLPALSANSPPCSRPPYQASSRNQPSEHASHSS